jgi:protein-tyrosine-phosphatase
MKTYILACIHNAGRSQMAAAFFNAVVDPTKARGVSAGTDPEPWSTPRWWRSCARRASTSPGPVRSS